MRIEDVSLREVQMVWQANLRARGRTRSPEVLRLIEVISELEPGEALAVGLDEGQSVVNLKSQVSRAAKVAGKNVEVVADKSNHRVMFAISDRPPKRRRSSRSN